MANLSVGDRVQFVFDADGWGEAWHITEEDLVELEKLEGAKGTITAVEEYDNEDYVNYTVEFDNQFHIATDFGDDDLVLIENIPMDGLGRVFV